MQERVAQVRARIERAAERAGRYPRSVTLVAVSKRHSAAAVREAYGLGLRAFGENYAQELVAKAAEVDLPDIAWHMIGHLQTNKVRLVTPVVSDVHSVDSVTWPTSWASERPKRGGPSVSWSRSTWRATKPRAGARRQSSPISSQPSTNTRRFCGAG